MPPTTAIRTGLAALGLALAAGLGIAGTAQGEEAGPPPNVLLVTFDTLRADFLGAYGHPDGASPHFDRLAERGVLFERAIAASARTVPSHATIMTSRYVRDHSVQHGNGPTRLGDEPTLARAFAQQGFATAAFVSNAVLERRTGLDRGFEVYDDELPDLERNRTTFERSASGTTDRAVAWLADAKRPFFLWVHYNDPHGPFTPPERFAEGMRGSPPERLSAAPDAPLPILNEQRGYRGVPHYQALPGLDRPSQYRARYDGEIRYADHGFGRLIREAEAASPSGLVILVTADHGEAMGESDFYFSHGHATTPDLVHVPLLLVAPGIAPARSGELVHHVDVLPTLLERAGVARPPGTAGVALGPHLETGTPVPDRVVFADVGTEVSGYRGERFERHRLRGELPGVPDGSRTSHRWSPRSAWEPSEPDPAITKALDAYTARPVRILRATEPSRSMQEQLRALGYLEPKPD